MLHGLRPLLASCALLACAGQPPDVRFAPPAEHREASPLGGSYVLLPLPGEDEQLLGRIFSDPPSAGRSLEEVARPNPCADKLTEVRTTPLANTYEDSEELAVGGSARAMLGAFGFHADVQRATHFLYKLRTSKRAAQSDTNDYVACCQEKGCGYGFVSALIYGDAEYATAEETNASGGANISIATATGDATVKVLHRRTVHGYVAALVMVTDGRRTAQLGPLGVAKEAGISEATVSDQVKSIYESGKISVCGTGADWKFCEKAGPITENEFVRRYAKITESDELAAHDRNRQNGLLIAGLATTAGSAGLIAFSVATWPDKATDTEDMWILNLMGTTFGGVGVLFGGGMTIGALSSTEGSPTDHSLAEYDGRLYAERYNRALLRRSIRDVQNGALSSQPSWRTPIERPALVRPVVTPTFIAVEGTF